MKVLSNEKFMSVVLASTFLTLHEIQSVILNVFAFSDVFRSETWTCVT